MKYFLSILLSLTSLMLSAQIRWHNPVTEKANLNGQVMPTKVRTNYYQRLPDEVKDHVRQQVWNLSQNAAGLSLKFKTNSKKIIVRYGVGEWHAYDHMPATGKSGVDLYAYDGKGTEKWCAAKYHFADTITFNYSPLMYDRSEGYDFELFLPPYNTVRWLEIGVEEYALFEFVEPSSEKPIIVYGTSIAQGACASRPGMIWTNIIARETRKPLINLGFSGNGLLEKGILDVIKVTPASLIIIDCMPNLMSRPEDELMELIVKSVKDLKSSHADTPILLVDHLGYPHSQMIDGWEAKTKNSIKAQTAAYKKLKVEGVKNLYYLSYDEIGMPKDGTVEAIHPSDYGMKIYADAYIKKLKKMKVIEKNGRF